MGYKKEFMIIDELGKKYNRLTVIAASERRTMKGGVYWVCLCECGNEVEIRANDLRNGNAYSCGCYAKEQRLKANTKHGCGGKNRTSEYNIWYAMTQRCTYKKCPQYKDYGGRGIKVCNRWLKFENFISDMGLRPSLNHSLDRFPNINGDYEPNNCRWATRYEQDRGKRSNIWFEINGVKKCQQDWAVELGTHSKIIIYHLKKGRSFQWIYNHFKQKPNANTV